MPSPRLNLIAALGQNGVIGIDNRLPWRLSEDLKHFKALTLGHPVLMGRKTYESLWRPLPGRRNIVITRNPECRLEGAEIAYSLEQALALCEGADEVFFIGGADLYRQALPLVQRLYLTEVAASPPGDAFFPSFDRARWRESVRDRRRDDASGLEYAFVTYDRA